MDLHIVRSFYDKKLVSEIIVFIAGKDYYIYLSDIIYFLCFVKNIKQT